MKKNFTVLVSVLSIVLLFATQAISQSDLSGSVLYHKKANKPVPSVNLNLIDTDGNIVATTTTATNGTFNFVNVPYGTYSMEASTAISAGGINLGDALLMSLHLLNIYPFNPLQKLAADVDGDGTVTWNDYFTVLVGWFVQGYPYPTGPWVFETTTYTHSGNKTNWPTVGGSSSGDVNGTFVPSTRDLPALEVNYTNQALANNFILNIEAGQVTEISAMGMIINYAGAEVNITRVSSPLGELEYTAENGQIRASWINNNIIGQSIENGSPVLVIEGNTTAAYKGGDLKFELDSRSHLVNCEGNLVAASYSVPMLIAGEHLSGNYPNPFNGNTTINYILPEDGFVSINLYNQHGQLVKVITSREATAGNYQVQFNSEGLNAGMYYYTLQTKGQNPLNETRRMVITR